MKKKKKQRQLDVVFLLKKLEKRNSCLCFSMIAITAVNHLFQLKGVIKHC